MDTLSKVALFFEKMHKIFKNKAQGCSTPLKIWILGQSEALKMKFYKIWGFGTDFFVNLGARMVNLVKNCDFWWKGSLKELKHAEMGVLGNCWESVKRGS